MALVSSHFCNRSAVIRWVDYRVGRRYNRMRGAMHRDNTRLPRWCTMQTVPSVRGLSRRVVSAEIAGSNPAGTAIIVFLF